MVLRPLLLVALAGILLIPSPASPAPKQPCNGQFAVSQYKRVAEKAWSPKRWRDATPVRKAERRRLNDIRRCSGNRRKLKRIYGKQRREFRNYFTDLISPPGRAKLNSIGECESGTSGSYRANTGNGFYGRYQFDLRTWNSVGGRGIPSSAPPREQDFRAAKLYRQRGSSPWPVCG